MIQFDKNKYIKLAKSQGTQTALTHLHDDIRQWEREAFEGEKGYQPEMIQELHQIREFSRELWEMELNRIQVS